jgi:hypothetical protein
VSPTFVIPRDVRFTNGCAFLGVKLWCISIDGGNERFVIREDLQIDIVHHPRIRNLSSSSSVIIPRDLEVLGLDCFSWFESLQSVSFESNSRLMRIESIAFPRIDGRITIPSAVLFIAHDAIGNPSQLSLCDEVSCPEFGRWLIQ